MKRYKGFFTQQYAAETVEPLGEVASLIIASCRDDGLEPVGTLTGKLQFIDRDKHEGKPEACVWTFVAGEC